MAVIHHPPGTLLPFGRLMIFGKKQLDSSMNPSIEPSRVDTLRDLTEGVIEDHGGFTSEPNAKIQE